VNIRSTSRLSFLLLLLLSSGCASIRNAVTGNMSESLATSAALSFAREDDPVLAAEAMPFALKTLDMLALQSPKNPDVLLAAATAYIQYSNAFLDWEARKMEEADFATAELLRARAANLYRRGRDYAIAALALRHPDPMNNLLTDPEPFLARMTSPDIPALYWLGAGWASLIAAAPSDMEEMTRLPLVEKIMRTAYALDPHFNRGALHEFFLLYDGSRSPAMGGDAHRAEQYFDRAVAASGGTLASPYVSLATTVAIQQQDDARFRSLLEQAIAIDLDTHPDQRLANTIAREKATWYLQHIDQFFVLEETDLP
jgi:predicted anti-sigma-YlaC factor YlaD